ncbi:MAG: hypothetical protein QM710_13520 [Flavobacterium sp.]
MKAVFLFLFCSLTAFSQDNIKDEDFKFILDKHEKEGKVIFAGNKHYFEVSLKGSLDTINVPHQRFDENNFVVIDKKKMLEFTTINVAHNILDLYDFNNLTITQQRNVLESYVNYELDYYKKDLGLILENYQLQVLYDEDRMYYFMSYKIGNKKESPSANVEKNIYLITIAFNHILVLNMPLTGSQDLLEYSTYLKGLIPSIKFYNKKYQ